MHALTGFRTTSKPRGELKSEKPERRRRMRLEMMKMWTEAVDRPCVRVRSPYAVLRIFRAPRRRIFTSNFQMRIGRGPRPGTQKGLGDPVALGAAMFR